MINQNILLLVVAFAVGITHADGRTQCSCIISGVNYLSFTDSASTCSSECSSGTTSSKTIDTYWKSYNEAQYKLLNYTSQCETTQSSPATKASFLQCADHITFFPATVGGNEGYFYGAFAPPINTECFVKWYPKATGSQTRPTRSSGEHTEITISNANGCDLEYRLIYGGDTLVDRAAVLGKSGVVERKSMTGSMCPTEGSVFDVCSKKYLFQELGTEGKAVVLFPHEVGSDVTCYTQFCDLNDAKTTCAGTDKINSIDFTVTVDKTKNEITVVNPDCTGIYQVTKGEYLGLKPIDELSSSIKHGEHAFMYMLVFVALFLL